MILPPLVALDQPLLSVRPFRTPDHIISDAGMMDGGNPPAPGEISLAHHVMLVLDELPEFHRRSLEVLRKLPKDGALDRLVRHFSVWKEVPHLPQVCNRPLNTNPRRYPEVIYTGHMAAR